MVNPALASILRSGRTEFNTRFAAARRIHPDLRPDVFGSFIETAIDELVSAVEKVRADRLSDVTQAAYDAGLELVGQKLAGPGARMAVVEEGWRRILPKIAPLVASAPGRVIPAICNALHQLASTPNSRPIQWLEFMEKFGPLCSDPDALLKLGQVCAWRAGLTHFRKGAIAAADTLPESLVLGVLNAAADAKWPDLRAHLTANPWFDPADTSKQPPTLRVVGQVGAFRGFGGFFTEPPLVAPAHGDFLVRSNSDCWLLTADAFGATFHRASTSDFETAANDSQLPSTLKISGSRVVLNGNRFEFPELGEFTSAAANDTTLALTSSLTHSIVLVALDDHEVRNPTST